MRGAVVVAAIAAVPPTLAAVLTFLQARAANRRTAQQDALGVARALGDLQGTVGRVEASVERIDQGVVELRERVARLEGARPARARS
ncbi:MAG: hypothetical protein QOK43_1118 [Acidimicrobiaceae bacterium]|nr:hypothetical protein [Acidimicrobiaceae bacterium]